MTVGNFLPTRTALKTALRKRCLNPGAVQPITAANTAYKQEIQTDKLFHFTKPSCLTSGMGREKTMDGHNSF